MRKITGLRLLTLVAVLAAAFALQGCTAAQDYFVYRFHDFAEMADGGSTITETPQIGLYWNSLEAFPIGYSEIDGYFVGFGGGQIFGLGDGDGTFGYTRHYNKCWGVGYGEEIIGWGPDLGEVGTVDPNGMDDVLIKRRSGFIGIATAILDVDVTDSGFGAGPNYTPSCVHFFPHIAYVGFVWNARYMEMVDFMLGWTTIDIAGDDGYNVGQWSFPWRSDDGGEM